MTKSLFPFYAECVSEAIKKADSKERQAACIILIDHLEEDYSYMQVPGKEERIQELRNQLQEKHDELMRWEGAGLA